MRNVLIPFVLLLASSVTAQTTVVDFESGAEGWEGPTGLGGSTFIDAAAGNGGGAGLHTIFNNFGITFTNDTNSAFIGDFTQFGEVTISIDIVVNQIGTFLPVGRPWLVELRDYDLAQGGFPWTSVWFFFDVISESNNSSYTTYSVTIADPSSTTLPAGWAGFGAEDPMTFEPILPPGVTFADVLAGVDEMAFTTLQPGFFFTFDDYDLVLDNITIAKADGTPTTYCTAKASSAGCVASIGTSNLAASPVSGANDYSVTAASVQGFKNGLVFGGFTDAAAIPFNGGTLCVRPPLRRGPIINSLGSNPVACDGTFSTVINDGINPPAGLDAGAGNTGWYQYWYRDPMNGAGSLGTALSNAVRLDFQ